MASDFYSGCSGVDAGATEFVSFTALEALTTRLDGYFTACTSERGPPEGASCVPSGTDGGP